MSAATGSKKPFLNDSDEEGGRGSDTVQTFLPGMMGLFAWKPGQRTETVDPSSENVRSLIYTYRTAPDAIASVLPEPLEPTQDPVVRICVNDVPLWRGLGDRHYEYYEAAFLVAAQFRGEVGVAVPFIYIGARDGDFTEGADVALAMGREMAGYPKKLANIDMYMDGDEWVCTIERRRTRILSFRARFEPEETTRPEWMASPARHLLVREVPSPDLTKYDLRQVIVLSTDAFANPTKLWRGDGSVELADAIEDPLGMLPVIEPGEVYHSWWDTIGSGATVDLPVGIELEEESDTPARGHFAEPE